MFIDADILKLERFTLLSNLKPSSPLEKRPLINEKLEFYKDLMKLKEPKKVHTVHM